MLDLLYLFIINKLKVQVYHKIIYNFITTSIDTGNLYDAGYFNMVTICDYSKFGKQITEITNSDTYL